MTIKEISPKVKTFTEANKASPIVYGAATYIPGEEERPENVTGVRYTLENGNVFTLKSTDCKNVKPRWKL